jgi:hypothetical protein
VSEHDVRDRERVARVGLAWPAVVALAVGPPGRDLQDLEARAAQGNDQATSVAARALDPDHRPGGVVIDQPIDQLPIALGAVGDAQRRDLAAAVIDQRGGMSLFVNIDADDQGGLLARG